MSDLFAPEHLREVAEFLTERGLPFSAQNCRAAAALIERLDVERDAAIARAEAAEAQVAKLREALTELLAVAQQAVDNVIVTCDRMWVSDAELADMARRAIARADLDPADKETGQ